MHESPFAADESFIALYDAVKQFAVGILDRFPDAVTEEPRGLVSDFQRALELSADIPFVDSERREIAANHFIKGKWLS